MPPTSSQPGDMPARIRAYCARTGQPIPADRGTVARVVFESLALKYRRTLEMLDELVGHRIAVLHIMGGGTQNRLLSQLAANAIGRPVVAGPIEATAAGNILMQMLATGAIGSLAEGRAVIRRSFDTERFEPRDTAAWDEAYARFVTLLYARLLAVTLSGSDDTIRMTSATPAKITYRDRRHGR